MAKVVRTAKEEESVIVIKKGQTTTKIKLGKNDDAPSLLMTPLADSKETWRVLYENHGISFAFFVHPMDGGLSIFCEYAALPGEDVSTLSREGVASTVLHDKVTLVDYIIYPPKIRSVGNKVIVEAFDRRNVKIGEVEVSESEIKAGDRKIVFETMLLQKRG